MGDYDRAPMEPPSQFLRLKTKGEVCRIRIASAPYREPKVWFSDLPQSPPMKPEAVALLTEGQWVTILRDPTYKVSEVFHFIVIDRTDGAAKIFSTTGGVYGKIRKLAQDDEWGDPKGYDLTVTRTESPGKNYYDLQPSPNKFPLTAEELGKVDGIRVNELLPAAAPAAGGQLDDVDLGTDPEPITGMMAGYGGAKSPPGSNSDQPPISAYDPSEAPQEEEGPYQ